MHVFQNIFKFHTCVRYYIAFICLVALISFTANALAGPLNSDCVIVLHGLGRSETSMEKVAKKLIKNNYRVWNQTYDSRDADIETLAATLSCALLVVAPFVFIKGLSNFADMPQRVFVQFSVGCLLLLWGLQDPFVISYLKDQLSGFYLMDQASTTPSRTSQRR